MSSLSSRKDSLALVKSFDESKAGVVRQRKKTGYNTATGETTQTYHGQVCELVTLPKGLKGIPDKNEFRQDEKKIILAMDEVFKTYDSSWTETGSTTQAPFVINQFMTIFFDGVDHSIIQLDNIDAGSDGVYELIIKA